MNRQVEHEAYSAHSLENKSRGLGVSVSLLHPTGNLNILWEG